MIWNSNDSSFLLLRWVDFHVIFKKIRYCTRWELDLAYRSVFSVVMWQFSGKIMQRNCVLSYSLYIFGLNSQYKAPERIKIMQTTLRNGLGIKHGKYNGRYICGIKLF